MSYIRDWYIRNPDQNREECNDLIYYLMMIIECEVMKEWKPSDSKNWSIDNAKAVWSSIRDPPPPDPEKGEIPQDPNQSMETGVLRIKDEKIDEIMKCFPYFPFEDWAYETDIYEMVATEVEARVWYEIIQHIVHFDAPWDKMFHDWINEMVKPNTENQKVINNGHQYNFIYMTAWKSIQPILIQLNWTELIPFVRDETRLSAFKFVNSLIKKDINDQYGNTTDLMNPDMMHIRPEDYFLEQHLLNDFYQTIKKLEEISKTTTNIQFLVTKVCVSMFNDKFQWFDPTEANKRIDNWVNEFASKNLTDWSYVYNGDIIPESTKRMLSVAKTAYENQKTWEDIRKKEQQDKQNEANQSPARDKCMKLLQIKKEKLKEKINIHLLDSEIHLRRDRIIKENPNWSIFSVYQKIILDLIDEITAIDQKYGQRLKQHDEDIKLYYKNEVEKWTYWFFRVKQLDWNENEWKNQCFYFITQHPYSERCLQAIVDQIDYQTNAVERFLAYWGEAAMNKYELYCYQSGEVYDFTNFVQFFNEQMAGVIKLSFDHPLTLKAYDEISNLYETQQWKGKPDNALNPQELAARKQERNFFRFMAAAKQAVQYKWQTLSLVTKYVTENPEAKI